MIKVNGMDLPRSFDRSVVPLQIHYWSEPSSRVSLTFDWPLCVIGKHRIDREFRMEMSNEFENVSQESREK